jgi:membrane protein DedA with SNARE-associated domain
LTAAADALKMHKLLRISTANETRRETRTEENILSQLLDTFIQLLHQWAGVFPLPVFVLVGTFVEELIAPIPSPIVMTLAGSLAKSQNQSLFYLFWLAVIGAVGKTISSFLLYFIAERGGELFLNKFGRFFGITAQEVEQFGRHLNQGWKDDIILIIFRALPIMPTAPVSIVCGLVSLDKLTYIRATLIGTFIRNIIYLYLGYTAIGALESLNEGLDGLEVFGYLIFFIVAAVGGIIFLRSRRRGVNTSFLNRWTGPKRAEK